MGEIWFSDVFNSGIKSVSVLWEQVVVLRSCSASSEPAVSYGAVQESAEEGSACSQCRAISAALRGVWLPPVRVGCETVTWRSETASRYLRHRGCKLLAEVNCKRRFKECVRPAEATKKGKQIALPKGNQEKIPENLP